MRHVSRRNSNRIIAGQISSRLCLFGILVLWVSGCQLRLARNIDTPTTASNPASETSVSNVVAAGPLSISPTSKILLGGNSFAFVASGGTTPYTFSVVSGTGSVNPSTGLYTAASSTTGDTTLRVTDSLGQTSDATVTIYPALKITPSSLRMTATSGTSALLSASGGVPPLSYSIISGPGSIGSSTGLYTAPTQSGASSVRVTDAIGNSANAPVQNIRIRTNGAVNTAVYAGSSWYLGGQFTAVNPFEAPGMIALDSTGNPLMSCDLDFNGAVSSFALSGNSLYVGGRFSTYQNQSAKGIAKLDLPGCTLDTVFSPPDSNGFSDGYGGYVDVKAIVISGSSLYAGGIFQSYRGVTNSANYLAKLDLTTGAIDTTFSPVGVSANGFGSFGWVYALAASGTSLYVGGSFTAYKGVANSANRLAKLNLTTGAIDTVFSPAGATANGVNGSYLYALAVSGTSLYLGGDFTAYKGVANSANRLAKLDLTTGVIDTTFSPVGATANGFDNSVTALTVSGTSLYVGGGFSAYKGTANSALDLAKLNLTTGAIDTTFSPVGANANGFNGGVTALVVSGSNLFVGGGFTDYKGVAGSANYLAKLDLTSGAIDTTFSATGMVNGFNGGVNAFGVSGSTLYVGGSFSSYGGQSATRIAKLDGTTYALDTTFSPSASNGFNNEVNALAVSGSSLYVGGYFTAYKGVANSANHLAKLDLTTGVIDTTFSPVGATANGFASFCSGCSVKALAVSGTSLYVGGNFSSYKGVASSANDLAKLNLTTGAIDTTFSPVGATANGFTNSGAFVNALAVSGTSLYVGGYFTAYKGVANSANDLAKLNLTTGVIDTTFSPVGATANGFGNYVYALAVSGSSLYVGGDFTAYKGVANSANFLAKLDLTSGALDTTFSPPASNGFSSGFGVNALAISGTSLYVGGWFRHYKGVIDSAHGIAKLDLTSGAIDTTFSPPGAGNNGFDTMVYSLAISGSSLYVGGQFGAYRGGRAYYFVPLDLTSGQLLDP